jgi:hypothetical protein
MDTNKPYEDPAGPLDLRAVGDGNLLHDRSEKIAPPAPAAGAPDPKALALAWPARARGIQVTNQPSLDKANGDIKAIKTLAAEISATFDPHIKRAFDGHRALVAEKRRFTDGLDQAERMIKSRVADYLYKLDQERLAAERATELARKAAEKTAEDGVDKAYELLHKGKLEEAEAVIDEATATAQEIQGRAPDVPEAPRAEGLSLRTTWEFEITDEAALPREYLKPDTTKIGQIVRALKDQAKIPGVRIFPKRSVAARIG